jgi:hypothetical protein
MFPREDPNPPIQLGLNQGASSDDPDVPAAESLQFRKAETTPEKRSCTFCREPISDAYYHIGGRVACPACAQARSEGQARRGGMPELGRAFLYGLGAALAGSALFAVVALVAHIRLGLLAIVVGVMVGKAVVHGARGCRGRRFQILAVLLTYFSIGSSYVPLFIAEAREHRAAKIAASGNQPSSPHAVRPAAAVAGLVFALVILTVLSLIAPFLELAGGFSGVIGLVIVFIGLRQAWHYARADEAPIMGPYTAGEVV